jgi:hypothetical protein
VPRRLLATLASVRIRRSPGIVGGQGCSGPEAHVSVFILAALRAQKRLLRLPTTMSLSMSATDKMLGSFSRDNSSIRSAGRSSHHPLDFLLNDSPPIETRPPSDCLYERQLSLSRSPARRRAWLSYSLAFFSALMKSGQPRSGQPFAYDLICHEGSFVGFDSLSPSVHAASPLHVKIVINWPPPLCARFKE